MKLVSAVTWSAAGQITLVFTVFFINSPAPPCGPRACLQRYLQEKLQCGHKVVTVGMRKKARRVFEHSLDVARNQVDLEVDLAACGELIDATLS
jgi:hypothetical protein